LCRQAQRFFVSLRLEATTDTREGGKTELAISKEKKQQRVAELKEMLTQSKAVIFSDYRGLTATQMAELRNKLRPLNSKLLVAKNTLVLRSLEELGLPQPVELLQGPTALSFCFGDFGPPVRTLMEFARGTEILSVKGGLLGTRVMDVRDVQVLTELPALEVLRAQALGSLQSPIGGFVSLLDSALRGLLCALTARAEQLGQAMA